MSTFYCLRYRPEAPLRNRKHAPTTRIFESFAHAEKYLDTLANADLLEVVEREVPAPVVVAE